MEYVVPEYQHPNSEPTEAAAPEADATVKTAPVEAPATPDEPNERLFIQVIPDCYVGNWLPNGP